MKPISFASVLCLQKKSTNQSAIRFQPKNLSNKSEKTSNFLVCSKCGTKICSPDDEICIHGKHSWEKVNPAGVHYLIRCFALAENCLAITPPTEDFSWFQGFAWSVIICSNCQSHLGWQFTGQTSSFFGMIETAIQSSH